jgi:diacylglycerol kinase family enzyme
MLPNFQAIINVFRIPFFQEQGISNFLVSMLGPMDGITAMVMAFSMGYLVGRYGGRNVAWVETRTDYLGDRPVDPNPGASFDLGLDVLALRALRVPTAARTFGQMLSRRRTPRGKQVVRWHDLPELTLRATHPLPFQVDGDYLGEQQKVQLRAVPAALRVHC